MISSLYNGGTEDDWLGLINSFSVFHQSRGPMSLFHNFTASLSVSYCFNFLISVVVLFLKCL